MSMPNEIRVKASGVDWSLFAGAETVRPPLSSRASAVSSSSTPGSSSTTPPSSVDGSPRLLPGEELPAPLKLARKGDAWAPKMVGVPQDPNDWLWLMTEEPHRSRRRAILKDFPEISKLMGHEPKTKWVVLAVVTLQLAVAAYFGHACSTGAQGLLNWRMFVAAYVIGGTANQNLFLAIHEITHNLAFKSIRKNRLLAMFANLPIAVPYAMLFKPYHLEHHKYLGEDGIDTDLPTRLELICLRNVAGKAFFATMQIFFYALRPGFVRAQKFTPWVAANFAVCFGFDYMLFRVFGGAAVFYLLLSSFFAGSLHPCAAHFIAEHYLFSQGGEQETWSYYGPLNVLAYNVGYHNEHHDFPSVPWTRLPRLSEIAAEYYDPLPRHESWPAVTWRFIFDPDVGLWSRVKREPPPHRRAQGSRSGAVRPPARETEKEPEEAEEVGMKAW